MTTFKRLKCPLEQPLVLQETSSAFLTVKAITLTLLKQEEQITGCRLLIQVSLEQYEHIDQKALFNLKPEVRGQTFAGGFLPEPEIEIEAQLKPELMPDLLQFSQDPVEVGAFFVQLNQEHPEHALFQTENWFGLTVKQERYDRRIKTGYRTSWADM